MQYRRVKSGKFESKRLIWEHSLFGWEEVKTTKYTETTTTTDLVGTAEYNSWNDRYDINIRPETKTETKTWKEIDFQRDPNKISNTWLLFPVEFLYRFARIIKRIGWILFGPVITLTIVLTLISMGDIPDFVVIPFMCNIIIIISASIVELALAIVGGLIASTLKTVTVAGNAIRQGELIVQNEINDSFNIIPGFNMLEIKIFESGQNVPPVNNRMYKSQFYSSSIRYLYFELHYSFFGSTQSFPLNYQIFKNNKEKECICNMNTGIELLNAPDGYNWFGWGHSNYTPWDKGKYTYNIKILDKEVASGVFEVI